MVAHSAEYSKTKKEKKRTTKKMLPIVLSNEEVPCEFSEGHFCGVL